MGNQPRNPPKKERNQLRKPPRKAKNLPRKERKVPRNPPKKERKPPRNPPKKERNQPRNPLPRKERKLSECSVNLRKLSQKLSVPETSVTNQKTKNQKLKQGMPNNF